MKKFIRESGIVVPLERANIDTDAIIPKQFLKSVKRTGFGKNLFDEWRYLDEGYPDKPEEDRQINPEFVLNNQRYQGASILLADKNFGCGSSREHAVWALDDYGFRAVITPSFADIFYNNCFKNGVLPIVLDQSIINQLFLKSQNEILKLSVDLEKQIVIDGDNHYSFEIDPFRKKCLLNGLDAIGLTLEHNDKIKAFEEQYIKDCPWIFESTSIK